MKILWFTWKDLKHPLAGGAEVVNEELAKRLVADGHEVVLIVGGFKQAEPEEVIDGYKIIRLGNKFTVYWLAYKYYKKHLQGWPDIIIEEVNTIPFLTRFYSGTKTVLVIHQLAREIWFYQMVFPLSIIGYMIEPLYLQLLNNQKVITISESTKQDLVRRDFKGKDISIITMASQMPPVKDLGSVKKYAHPTVLSLGAIRSMKRTDHQVKAFEVAKRMLPELQLKIAGDASGRYGQRVLKSIESSPYAADIEYLGKVTPSQKRVLMQRSHAILVTSIKEGWGLIVTEAATQGTPAIVYDADGLRDSVLNGKTGIICPRNNPADLANAIKALLTDQKQYNNVRNNAWLWNKKFTFERTYKEFKENIN